jgi:type II secretory pathway predicted ATPase ExeA
MRTTTTTAGLTLRQLTEREERVFPTYPQVGRYFPAASMEDARHRLGRAIERGDGPGLVIGGPGTGKSLLLQVLASQYHERFDVVLPACARLCTRRALLQAILFELGLPYRVRDEGDLRLSLLDHLLSREECPTGLLLLVDEAQTLSINLLDELRVLTNLVRGGLPRVRLVLAGSSALEESFAHPDLESFSQRLAARCYLGPFGREETTQFVRAQIAASSGAPDELFSQDAWEAIFDATDGVPRLVNQLCDRALLEASEAKRSRIDCSIIQAAWADIQQLPAPWDTPAPTTAPPAPLQVVEFGQLESTSKSEVRPAEQLFVEPEDDLSEIDSTELDDVDDEIIGASKAPAIPTAKVATDSNSSNPFAEEFDEEEVVIDSFASWDEMFRRDVPRVQNRRDPEFAALVQSAISPGAVSETVVSAPTSAALRMLDTDLDNYEAAAANLPRFEPPQKANSTTDWPPLRIAIVPESTPASDDLLESIQEKAISSTEWNVPQFHQDDRSWSRRDSVPQEDFEGGTSEVDGEPVLIVEDDNAVPKLPVRREEYRNLFSRLRSG